MIKNVLNVDAALLIVDELAHERVLAGSRSHTEHSMATWKRLISVYRILVQEGEHFGLIPIARRGHDVKGFQDSL